MEYSKFLHQRHIAEYYKQGIKEVYLIFDTPQRHKFNPKQFEQARHDEKLNSKHKHMTFSPLTPHPSRGRIICIAEHVNMQLLRP